MSKIGTIAATTSLVAVVAVVAGCAGTTTQDATTSTSATSSANPTTTRTVTLNDPGGMTGGYIFFNEGSSPASAVVGTHEAGPHRDSGSRLVIADKRGRVVWSRPAPAGQSLADFRVQTLHGRPVLTWWQGSLQSGQAGVDYIADDRYQIIGKVDAAESPGANIHEFRLTDDGRAWITVYQPVKADLSAVGGPKDGTMYDGMVEEVDVRSGKVLFEWRASQHVPITDSYISPSDTVDNSNGVYDPYHLNSISIAPNGNLILSMRHTSTVYEVNPATGAIVWQIGGKHSAFALGKGVEFSFQHDAQMQDADTLRLFNNNSDGQTTNGATSIMWIHLDTAAHTATLVRNQTHPGGVSTAAMGNAQMLADGNVFGSWGTGAHISEFTPTGAMVYDMTLAPAGSYRAYYQPWSAHPISSPEFAISSDEKTLHARWNGATGVARWRVLGGSSAAALTPVTTVDWNGADTSVTLPQKASGFYQVEALDANGTVMGRSVALPA